MKTKVFVISILLPLLAACGGKKSVEAQVEEAHEVPVLDGVWQLTSYVLDGDTVKVGPEREYHLKFVAEEELFGMNTDCNSIGGHYLQTADSLVFDNMMSTEMACVEEQIEMVMKAVLPKVATYCVADGTELTVSGDDGLLASFVRVNPEEEPEE